MINYFENINYHTISIITVVLNGDKHIEESINSVLSQKYNKLQYILIDGGSTDKTIEIINKYKKNINYFISEKDHGIYDAFNKGLSCLTSTMHLPSRHLFMDHQFIMSFLLHNACQRGLCFLS